MSTGLTSENERFVCEAIQTGSYSTREDVLNDALALLREREELRRKINAGIEQIERGELLDGNEVFDRLEERAREIVAGASANNS
jgi:antitoxin ParD1/3/4